MHIGFPEMFTLFPIAVVNLLFYGAIFCVWKFYQLLSKINDNLTGIRQTADHNGPNLSSGA